MSGSCYNCRYKLGPIELHIHSKEGQSRCGKGPFISIYFAYKLVSSGYAYLLNIAKFSCIVLSEMLHRPGLTPACGFRRAKVAAGRLSLFLFAFDVNKPHQVIPKRGRFAARVWVVLAIAENCQPV